MFASRRRLRVTREGWYYLLVLCFILVGIVLRQVNLLVVLAGLMVGLFIFHWRLTAQMLRMYNARRRLPRWICAGDPLTVEITLVNRRRRLAGSAVTVQDSLTLEGAKDAKTQVEMIIPRVEAQAEAKTSYAVDIRRRGRYRFGPMRVSTRFPFGLVRGSVAIARHDSLLVCPRLGRLSRSWANVIEGAKAGQARTQHRKGLVDGEFYGLRDWRAGDSPRWIHWRTSAKLAKLSVRQFEQQRNRDVALVIDLWRPTSPSQLDRYHVELAVSFAATAVADICRRGGSRLLVGYAGVGHRQQAAPASQIFMQDLLQELAEVQAGDAEELPKLLADVLESSHAGERIVVISTRENQASAVLRELGPKNSPFAAAALENVRWIDIRSPEAARLFRLGDGEPPTAAESRASHEAPATTVRRPPRKRMSRQKSHMDRPHSGFAP